MISQLVTRMSHDCNVLAPMISKFVGKPGFVMHNESSTQTQQSSRSAPISTTAPSHSIDTRPVVRHPVAADGAAMWRIARDSRVLDLNSSYAYVLWCRDFRTTSVVAEMAGEVVGFVSGYLRPAARDTLFVWQVAVEHRCRGRGAGAAMLDHLVGSLVRQGVSKLETTISPDNRASIAMFTSLARRHGAQLTQRPLFEAADFPDRHAAEELYRIAPLNRQEIHR